MVEGISDLPTVLTSFETLDEAQQLLDESGPFAQLFVWPPFYVISVPGIIVGMPVAHLLQSMDATVTVCHSRTADLAAHCRRADIVVAAIGKAEMVPADWIKPGATVIDVGINSKDAPELPKGYRLCGDVDFESVKAVAGAITPVPGGVGPMTIAMLMKNTLNLARHAAGLPRLPLRAPTPAPA